MRHGPGAMKPPGVVSVPMVGIHKLWEFIMRFRLCFTVALLAMIVGVAPAWAGQAADSGDQQAKAPRIVAPEGNYHFSSVVDGTKVEHEFVIENRGNAPLKISRVKTG